MLLFVFLLGLFGITIRSRELKFSSNYSLLNIFFMCNKVSLFIYLSIYILKAQLFFVCLCVCVCACVFVQN